MKEGIEREVIHLIKKEWGNVSSQLESDTRGGVIACANVFFCTDIIGFIGRKDIIDLNGTVVRKGGGNYGR